MVVPNLDPTVVAFFYFDLVSDSDPMHDLMAAHVLGDDRMVDKASDDNSNTRR